MITKIVVFVYTVIITCHLIRYTIDFVNEFVDATAHLDYFFRRTANKKSYILHFFIIDVQT
jgi:hypothetical protein